MILTNAVRNAIRNASPRFTAVDAMDKRPCFCVSLVAITILTVCLYFSAFYTDSGLRNTFLRTYAAIHDAISENTSDAVRQRLVKSTEFRSEGVKTVLLWNTFFGDRNFYFGEGDVFHGCPVSRCSISNDRGHMNVEDFDAILFHGNELDRYDLPAKRNTEQLYVYVNLESPANRPISNSYYEDYFNLTMTYRLDSDVPWSYGIVEDVRSGKFLAPSKDVDWNASRNGVEEAADEEVPSAILDVVRGKSKPVTWFVSNCDAKSGRLEYVKELSKHIGVDVYGNCGKFSCSKSLDCFRDVIEPDYFFYLSFENTFCDDYVTEKLMNPLRYIVAPVVYGGANYSQFAPPNSYVNALDFESPKELAAYLKYLIQDLRRYQSFLQWKKYYRVKQGTKRAVCNLCEVLHKQKTPKRYSPLSDWYARDKCPMQDLLRETEYRYMTKMTLMSRSKN